MISFNNIINRLDVVFYVIVFAIIYVAIIYLWKKIAQLESSFYKLETTFATQLLYKNKENNANQFAEDMFMKVFDNKMDSPDIEILEKKQVPISIKEDKNIITVDNIDETHETRETRETRDPILTEVSDMLTPSTDENYFTKSKLAKMSVEQLKEHCGNFGYSVEGTKPELINKLLTHQQK